MISLSTLAEQRQKAERLLHEQHARLKAIKDAQHRAQQATAKSYAYKIGFLAVSCGLGGFSDSVLEKAFTDLAEHLTQEQSR